MVLPRRSFKAISFPFSSCKVKSGALSLIFMGVSPGESKSCGGNAAERACGQPACFRSLHRAISYRRILHRKILRRGLLLALLAGVVGGASFAAAQEERPQI